MKKYKHLVFDIDGTMIDSLPVHMVSLIKTLREITGREYTEEELKFTFGIPGDATMRQLGISDPDAAVERWLDNLVEAGSKDIPLFPGIRELLEKLQEKGVHLGIVTSKMRSEYIAQFTANGLLPFFDNVVTADDTPKGKPDPAPMFAYMKMTGAASEEILFFGDTVYDMDCARGAGVDHALVLWGCLCPDEIEATYKLEKVEDILDFV